MGEAVCKMKAGLSMVVEGGMHSVSLDVEVDDMVWRVICVLRLKFKK